MKRAKAKIFCCLCEKMIIFYIQKKLNMLNLIYHRGGYDESCKIFFEVIFLSIHIDIRSFVFNYDCVFDG